MTRARLAAICAAALAAAVTPVVVRAPKPALSLPGDVRSIDEAVTALQSSPARDWDLVNEAVLLVNAKFTRYSLWHFWENSDAAFRNSRGFAYQYNLALLRILRRLGIQAQGVHAARVRFEPAKPSPWWASGHMWVRVTIDGQTRDVGASDASNRSGSVNFIPVSDARPLNLWTVALVRATLAPNAVWQVWRSWLTGKPVPRWFYRSFHGHAS